MGVCLVGVALPREGGGAEEEEEGTRFAALERGEYPSPSGGYWNGASPKLNRISAFCEEYVRKLSVKNKHVRNLCTVERER